jgi:hypothetical protein
MEILARAYSVLIEQPLALRRLVERDHAKRASVFAVEDRKHPMEVLAASSVLEGDAITNAPVAEALTMHAAFSVEDAVVVDRLHLAGVRWGDGNDSEHS